MIKKQILITKAIESLSDLSEQEKIAVRYVAKSLEDDVNFLRTVKSFDSKRMAALEERINCLNGGSPVRINPLLGDEIGKGELGLNNVNPHLSSRYRIEQEGDKSETFTSYENLAQKIKEPLAPSSAVAGNKTVERASTI
ncbi:hypothetical protein U1Q18_026423 [Sarracenia purpurea var. burkii]